MRTDFERRFSRVLEEKDEQTDCAKTEVLVTRGEGLLELLVFYEAAMIPIHHLEAPNYIGVSTGRKGSV